MTEVRNVLAAAAGLAYWEEAGYVLEPVTDFTGLHQELAQAIAQQKVNVNGISVYKNPHKTDTLGFVDDAIICRLHAWGVGDILEGDEGYGPTRIKITSIGEKHILARRISHNGKSVSEDEGHWTLSARNWQRVND